MLLCVVVSVLMVMRIRSKEYDDNGVCAYVIFQCAFLMLICIADIGEIAGW